MLTNFDEHPSIFLQIVNGYFSQITDIHHRQKVHQIPRRVGGVSQQIFGDIHLLQPRNLPSPWMQPVKIVLTPNLHAATERITCSNDSDNCFRHNFP